jgi:hypothetical protein
MINEERIGKDVEGSGYGLNFKADLLYWHLPGEAEEKHRNSEPEEPISGSRFEPGASRIRSGITKLLATSFGLVILMLIAW